MEFSGIKSGNYLVLTVGGRMDALSAPEFEAECGRWLAAGEKRLVVDLAGLGYISSAGCAASLTVARNSRPRERPGLLRPFGIVARSSPCPVRLKLCRCSPTQEEALAPALRRRP